MLYPVFKRILFTPQFQGRLFAGPAVDHPRREEGMVDELHVEWYQDRGYLRRIYRVREQYNPRREEQDVGGHRGGHHDGLCHQRHSLRLRGHFRVIIDTESKIIQLILYKKNKVKINALL